MAATNKSSAAGDAPKNGLQGARKVALVTGITGQVRVYNSSDVCNFASVLCRIRATMCVNI